MEKVLMKTRYIENNENYGTLGMPDISNNSETRKTDTNNRIRTLIYNEIIRPLEFHTNNYNLDKYPV